MKKRSEIRFLYDMKSVVYDKEWLKKTNNFPVYSMYRGIRKESGLRYDITVIPSRMLGKEFVRTKGNRNARGLQELYGVLKGETIFFIQKAKKNIIKDVFAIRAKKGEWAIVPPYYAVITINPSKKELKIGNWVSEKCKNIYKELERMGGPCYFYTKEGWVKNKNYKRIPKLRFKKPLKSIPKNLDFLKSAN